MGIIPMIICLVCNLWAGISWLLKERYPMSICFFCWAGSTAALIWEYCLNKK